MELYLIAAVLGVTLLPTAYWAFQSAFGLGATALSLIHQAQTLLIQAGYQPERATDGLIQVLNFKGYQLKCTSNQIRLSDTSSQPFDGIRFGKHMLGAQPQTKAPLIPVGDNSFDNAFWVSLQDPTGIVRFSRPIRRGILHGLAKFHHDTLCFPQNKEGLAFMMTFLEQMNLNTTQAALANLDDTYATVRVANLELLTQQYPDDPELNQWMDQQSDTNPLVQLKISIHKNRGDTQFLHELLASSTLSEQLVKEVLPRLKRDDEVDMGAVYRNLFERDNVPLDLLINLFEKHMKDADNSLAPLMLTQFSRTSNHQQKLKVLGALSHFNTPEVRSFLIEYLEQELTVSVNWELPKAVCISLAVIGEREDIEALFQIMEKTNHYFVKKAVQDTVRAIQSRLGPLEAGGLSLSQSVTSQTGALSMPAAEDGALSGPEETLPDTKTDQSPEGRPF